MDSVWIMEALLSRPARPVSAQRYCVALSSTLSRDTTKIFEGSYLLLVMAVLAVSLSGGDTTMYSVMSHETRCPGTLSAGFAIR
jgi:hypothetical protein